MANNLSQKPWRIDTVATTGTQIAGRIKVRNIQWASAATAGHVCTIVDADGNHIWSHTASANNYSVLDNINSWWFNGFRVQVLGSGVVFVDYE